MGRNEVCSDSPVGAWIIRTGPNGQAKVQGAVWLKGQLSLSVRGEMLATALEPEGELETAILAGPPVSVRCMARGAQSGVAMSAERRIIFGLGDIKAVTFACYACNARVSFSPDDLIRIPQHCHCGQRWVIGDVPTNSPFRKLTDALYAARNTIKPETAGFRLLLEFEEPASVMRHDAFAAKS